MKPPAATREEYIENYVDTWRILAGPVHFTDERFRERGGQVYDRCFYPVGTGRQLLGVLASGSRADALRGLRVPTLVIHGVIDPLVGISGGRRTAELVPNAELVEFDDMGHDCPAGIVPADRRRDRPPHLESWESRIMSSGPLSGIKIIELAGIGPGPFCAFMLADMGADIIKIDRADRVRGG